MAERIYKLTLKSPLHVGTWGIDREETLSYIPSDTLFSAFVIAWRLLGQASLQARLASYLGNDAPPILLSSAFPYAGEVRFFPRPQLFLEMKADIPFKRIKKANWVSENIFHQLRQGKLPAEYNETVNFVQNKQVWLTRSERQRISEALHLPDEPDDPASNLLFWHPAMAPRVTVDRLGSASNLFHTGRIKFAPGCGLWFAARGDDLSDVDFALNYLEDAGIGGLRSTGHGAFEYAVWQQASPLPQVKNGNYFINLARFAPNNADELQKTLKQPASAYKLVKVAGWCRDDAAHPWRRKQAQLVAEGAYLGYPGYVPGKIIDVTPEKVASFSNARRVYRYGFAYPVGAQ